MVSFHGTYWLSNACFIFLRVFRLFLFLSIFLTFFVDSTFFDFKKSLPILKKKALELFLGS